MVTAAPELSLHSPHSQQHGDFFGLTHQLVTSLTTGAASSVRVLIRVDRGAVASQAVYNALVAHEFGHALGIGAHSTLTITPLSNTKWLPPPERLTTRFQLACSSAAASTSASAVADMLRV